MKGKPTIKIQRRAAGLQIKTTLEPRPDSGANLASDIFRAARENETLAENLAQTSLKQTSELPADFASDLKKVKNNQSLPSKAAGQEGQKGISEQSAMSASNIVVSKTPPFINSGERQMRVVSLQAPKPRKTNKPPKKQLQILAGRDESEKIPTLFERTKAEELYDLLYQLTLGAAEPCSSVRVRRSDLMASTNIKTRLTLDLNLKRLEENELLAIESRPGEQEGNIYTVFPLPKAKQS